MRLDSEVIPIRERSSILFLRCGRLDVEDGALVLVDTTGVRMQIPLGGIVCLLLEPGTVFPTHVGMNRFFVQKIVFYDKCSPHTWG